jgi:hypothetical protein
MRTVLWYLNLDQHALHEFPPCHDQEVSRGHDQQGSRDPVDNSLSIFPERLFIEKLGDKSKEKRYIPMWND